MSADEMPEPRRSEPQSTVLARIEGKVDLVSFKVDDLRTRVSTTEGRLDKHDDEFESVRLTMQRLGDEAKARAASDAAAAAAVAATRQSDREESDRRWTPAARFGTTLSTVAFLVTAVYAVIAHYTGH
ncbi:MAG TPA: hypothetical protein VMV41_07815 [Cellulomonadaceae bacterium]|nr:hypothetical protein [Cellulomonadaceae bacterium]